ncbi:hypothetical protein GOP47_0025950 [Adiantum capillus-veneris]|uniref:Malectin-like domain-containing protein n=1 Tax=Adiantum capillus-veneris TaxID=13818 RepID=A0A9D4U112_ADICA|nr:hypothetical protein GOP47_0025950 [Adiantum capillus-veneris]
MTSTNVIADCFGHTDYGVPTVPDSDSFIRYNFDALDWIWIARKALATENVNTTTLAIDANLKDEPPSRILQTTLVGSPDISVWYSELQRSSEYVAVFYFAEIDPAVTASGQRTFNIYANDQLMNTAIDVFALVGANAAYAYSLDFTPN